MLGIHDRVGAALLRQHARLEALRLQELHRVLRRLLDCGAVRADGRQTRVLDQLVEGALQLGVDVPEGGFEAHASIMADSDGAVALRDAS